MREQMTMKAMMTILMQQINGRCCFRYIFFSSKKLIESKSYEEEEKGIIGITEMDEFDQNRLS